LFGTNPIGIGLPTEPVIDFDFATSKRTWGEVRVAAALGTDVPKEAFLKKDGSFATKPDEAYSAVPFGGYKGSAICLLVEILTGALVGIAKDAVGDYRTTLRGAVVIAIDASVFTSGFGAAVSSLLEDVRKEARVPGERSEKKRKELVEKGEVEVDEGIWKEIEEIS